MDVHLSSYVTWLNPILQSRVLAFPKQSLLFTALQTKIFESIVGKGENAGNQHFFLFPHCFLPYLRQKSSFKQRFKFGRAQNFVVWQRFKHPQQRSAFEHMLAKKWKSWKPALRPFLKQFLGFRYIQFVVNKCSQFGLVLNFAICYRLTIESKWLSDLWNSGFDFTIVL